VLEGAAGEEDAGETPLGVVLEPEGAVGEVDTGETPVGAEGEVSVSVTGQIVVEIAMVEVITVVEWAGQLMTVGAQLVIVISVVV